jgi:ribosomal protein S18 acetylase RimI-like enzyme
MLDCFRADDIPQFLAFAADEGWLCDPWELRFLMEVFPSGCLCWRDHEETRGFITAVKYADSGWIGNLIVAPGERGRGIGSRLMAGALAALEGHGTQTVWLTASLEGEPLYRKLGFHSLDCINRWRGRAPVRLPPAFCRTTDHLLAIDRAGWGDSRDRIFAALEGRGRLSLASEGFLVMQEYAEGIQVGPWGGSSMAAARQLFTSVLQGDAAEHHLFLDVPGKNRIAPRLLESYGFNIAGNSQLMYLGRSPDYRPTLIHALASMGSFG